jgi:hypothetical protein
VKPRGAQQQPGAEHDQNGLETPHSPAIRIPISATLRQPARKDQSVLQIFTLEKRGKGGAITLHESPECKPEIHWFRGFGQVDAEWPTVSALSSSIFPLLAQNLY